LVDSVRIVTGDEKEHRLVVTGINADEIRGKVVTVHSDADEIREAVVTIPIDSVVAVETPEFSTGKTALLAGGITGTVLLLIIVAIAIAPAAILAASAP
jgi:hypothetical protein